MKQYLIDFEPVGRRGSFPQEKSLLDGARGLGVGIAATCGGRGTCHSCIVHVVKGNVSLPTSGELRVFNREELKKGLRLACQTYPLGNCTISVPPESMTTSQRMQVEGVEKVLSPDPVVKSYNVKIRPPSLTDLEGDAERLISALNRKYSLKCRKIDISLLKGLSPLLRKNKWLATASRHRWECKAIVRGDEVIGVTSKSAETLGLAVDMGTTKVAGYLIDLKTGRTLSRKAIMNPQISFGEDIVSRMSYASASSEGCQKMQELAVSAVNELASDLCNEVKAKREEIFDAVIVGNTAIHHLLLGLPVRQLATAPYVPALSSAIDVKAKELGIKIAGGAYVHLLPNIAGYVGGDHTAALLSTSALRLKGRVILIDIGTNTEISLIDNGEITSVSCASGPAFEGGHIRFGMRASSGAIERININGKRVEVQTIDGKPPTGICGSGILDALAEMYLAGILDSGGRIQTSHPSVRSHDSQREFVVVKGKKDIAITQGDVRELQLAKAAIRTGIQILLEARELEDSDIDRIIIAGAFGSYISIESAITSGMLPALPKERLIQVGNAAGMGAKLAIISARKRREAQKIAAKAKYIELAGAPYFNETFIQATYLGKYRLSHGRREEIK